LAITCADAIARTRLIVFAAWVGAHVVSPHGHGDIGTAVFSIISGMWMARRASFNAWTFINTGVSAGAAPGTRHVALVFATG
jgi:hypothetical protein